MEAQEGEWLEGASAWDFAVRYQDLKSISMDLNTRNGFEDSAIRSIIEKAKKILGPLSHQRAKVLLSYEDRHLMDSTWEIAIEETLDQMFALKADDFENIIVEGYQHKKHPMVIVIDTSLSMDGEKLAITAVALAVVLLQFKEDLVGVVTFESEAKILKAPNEEKSIEYVIREFFDQISKGYTHLEDGLLKSLKLISSDSRNRAQSYSTVLLTDGKYTAGRDPAYLAGRFGHLSVLKMGDEKSSKGLCRELAFLGNGRFREVNELENLPGVMYGVVKDLLRGTHRFSLLSL